MFVFRHIGGNIQDMKAVLRKTRKCKSVEELVPLHTMAATVRDEADNLAGQAVRWKTGTFPQRLRYFLYGERVRLDAVHVKYIMANAVHALDTFQRRPDLFDERKEKVFANIERHLQLASCIVADAWL